MLNNQFLNLVNLESHKIHKFTPDSEESIWAHLLANKISPNTANDIYNCAVNDFIIIF